MGQFKEKIKGGEIEDKKGEIRLEEEKQSNDLRKKHPVIKLGRGEVEVKENKERNGRENCEDLNKDIVKRGVVIKMKYMKKGEKE